jgi:hypothetical protein
VISNMLTKLGATPVGMPVPAVTDALSKGVIEGTTIPWEVTPALKVSELVKNHTTFAGKEGPVHPDLCVLDEQGRLRQAAGRPEEGDRRQFGH